MTNSPMKIPIPFVIVFTLLLNVQLGYAVTLRNFSPTESDTNVQNSFDVGQTVYVTLRDTVPSNSAIVKAAMLMNRHWNGGLEIYCDNWGDMSEYTPQTTVTPGSTVDFSSSFTVATEAAKKYVSSTECNVEPALGEFQGRIVYYNSSGQSIAYSDWALQGWTAVPLSNCTEENDTINLYNVTYNGDSDELIYDIRIYNNGCEDRFYGYTLYLENEQIKNVVLATSLAPKSDTKLNDEKQSISLSPGTYQLKAKLTGGNYPDEDTESFTVEGPRSIALSLFKISDTSGTPHTSNPGDEKASFSPGDTIRITLSASNSSSALDVVVSLNIRDPNDNETPLFYDSHTVVEDVIATIPQNGTTYFSFDCLLPETTPTGDYDLLAAVRDTAFVTVFDTLGNGPDDQNFEWQEGFSVARNQIWSKWSTLKLNTIEELGLFAEITDNGSLQSFLMPTPEMDTNAFILSRTTEDAGDLISRNEYIEKAMFKRIKPLFNRLPFPGWRHWGKELTNEGATSWVVHTNLGLWSYFWSIDEQDRKKAYKNAIFDSLSLMDLPFEHKYELIANEEEIYRVDQLNSKTENDINNMLKKIGYFDDSQSVWNLIGETPIPWENLTLVDKLKIIKKINDQGHSIISEVLDIQSLSQGRKTRLLERYEKACGWADKAIFGLNFSKKVARSVLLKQFLSESETAEQKLDALEHAFVYCKDNKLPTIDPQFISAITEVRSDILNEFNLFSTVLEEIFKTAVSWETIIDVTILLNTKDTLRYLNKAKTKMLAYLNINYSTRLTDSQLSSITGAISSTATIAKEYSQMASRRHKMSAFMTLYNILYDYHQKMISSINSDYKSGIANETNYLELSQIRSVQTYATWVLLNEKLAAWKVAPEDWIENAIDIGIGICHYKKDFGLSLVGPVFSTIKNIGTGVGRTLVWEKALLDIKTEYDSLQKDIGAFLNREQYLQLYDLEKNIHTGYLIDAYNNFNTPLPTPVAPVEKQISIDMIPVVDIEISDTQKIAIPVNGLMHDESVTFSVSGIESFGRIQDGYLVISPNDGTGIGAYTATIAVQTNTNRNTQTAIQINVLPNQILGSVSVNILPEDPIKGTGKWRIVEYSDWLDSGMVIEQVPVNINLEIEFKQITDWTKPPNLSINLSANENKTFTVSYVHSPAVIPVIQDIRNETATEGQTYFGPTPVLSQGSSPANWILVSGPQGMEINDRTGNTTWINPKVSDNPYSVVIQAENSAGYHQKTWQLTVTQNSNDSDNDGVIDDMDECPGTPQDESAGEKGCSPSQLPSGPDLNAGLMAYFPFNGNAVDESLNSNNGSVQGATLTMDRFGNPDSAYNFDGVDDYIAVPNDLSLDAKDAISLVAWIKPNKVKHDVSILSNTTYLQSGYELWQYVDNNQVYYVFRAYDSPTYAGINSEKRYDINRFHLLVTTYDKTTGVVKIYVDGELDHFREGITDGLITPGKPLWIGGWASIPGTRHFSGVIDDIRIYNRAITGEEVEALYAEKINPNSELFAYYPFNGNANDESGNGNDGDITSHEPTLVADRFGNPDSAYEFDGIDDYINLGGNFNNNLQNGFSISGWYYFDSEKTMSILSDFDGQGTYTGFSFTLLNDKIRFNGHSGHNTYAGRETDSICMPGRWYHITGVFDGTPDSSGFKIYIDAQRSDVADIWTKYTYTSWENSPNPIYAGVAEWQAGMSNYFDGKMDEIYFYNRALSEVEIKQLFNAGTNLTKGLVAFYPFNNNANDESGNAKNGTVNGPVPADDRFGNPMSAYSFDGINDEIVLGYWDIPAEGTISLWLNWNGAPSQKPDWPSSGILGKWSGTDSCHQYPLGITMNTADRLAGFWNQGVATCNGSSSVSTTKPFVPDTWYHLLVTWDKDLTHLFINGELIDTDTGRIAGTGTQPVTVGRRRALPGYGYFGGLIDDVRIYNLTLTAAQVKALYQTDTVPYTISAPLKVLTGKKVLTIKPGSIEDIDNDGKTSLIDAIRMIQ